MRISVFSHADKFLFDIAEADVFECVRTEEINGEHSLSLTTTARLEQSYRLLLQDTAGTWREYVVTGNDELHDAGKSALGTYYAVWSIQHDLSTVYGEERRPGVGSPVSAGVALSAALADTKRWNVGRCDVTTSGGVSMYNNSAWERIADVIAEFGGELDARISVSATAVTKREVMLYATQGSNKATRRFDWGRDTVNIRRTPPEGARVCRVKFLGKGEESGDGYGRKITIADANNGIDYLRDTQAEAAFRLPDGSGGWEYPTAIVENGDITDPEELKTWGQEVLHDYTRPTPSYEASVLQYAQAGMDTKGVSLGDIVHIVDKGFNPSAALRIEARIVKVVTNELDPADVQLTIGQIQPRLSDYFKKLDSRMQAASSKLDAMWVDSGGSPSTSAYLDWLLDRLNAEINATGGWTYITPGHGLRTYDKEVSDPLVGSEAASVVELKGGNIRIANSRKANGDWDWKTVIQSGHIAAELVTAARLTTGYIGSPSGNYWNLDTGQVNLTTNVSVAGTTLADIAKNSKNAANAVGDVSLLKAGSAKSVDVQYGISSSASAQPTSWQTTARGLWNQKGKFLWSRQKITMYNGKVTYSTPRLLSDGKQLVKSMDEQYYLSTSKSAPAGGSWSSTQQSYVNGRYYFTRTKIEWVDGTITYEPSVNGELVQAFTSVRDVYDSRLDQLKVFNILTKNGTAQGFKTDEKGNLYFNASYIATGILSDKRGLNYWNLNTGDVRMVGLAAVEEKVDNLKVGGTNLLNGTAAWTGWTKRRVSVSGEQANFPAQSKDWDSSIYSPLAAIQYGKVKGKEVTVSFDVKCSSAWGTVADKNAVWACLELHTTSTRSRHKWRTFRIAKQPTTTWQRVSFTTNVVGALFTGGTGSISDTNLLGLEIYNRSNKALQIRRVKMEIGNVATDWCATDYDAQLDAQAKANSAANNALTQANKNATDKANKALSDAKADAASKIAQAKKDAYAYSKTYADGISKSAKEYTDKQKKDLRNSLNQAAIFNELTDNGKVKTFRFEKGELYINATYIKSGTLDASVLKAGVIAPKYTPDGSFQINMETGYAMFKNVNLQNMTATGGKITSDAGTTKLQIYGGQLNGYRGKNRVGFIDATARTNILGSKTNKVLKTVDGLQIQSEGILRISSPRISVADTADTTKTAMLGFTGSLRLNQVTFNTHINAKGGVSWTKGDVELKFINGIFVGVGDYTSYTKWTKQEAEGK